MRIEDIGFITFVKKYEENSLLVKILSKESGLISGYLRHTSKNLNHYQVGNMVKFNWTAKTVNQLGSLKIELIKSYVSHFIEDRFFISIIDNISFLINELLLERYLETQLFFRLQNIFDLITLKSQREVVIREYLYFENELLNILGSGVIFDNNSDIENMCYISPKTGLAVCQKKGEPYKERLLTFPNIFRICNISKNDVCECFDVLDFFMKKYLTSNDMMHRYINIAKSREGIIGLL